MRSWTRAEVSKLRSDWRNFSDRQIAEHLGRSLESVRSFRQRNVSSRWPSPSDRWKGEAGNTFVEELIQEYQKGASQSELSEKYRIEWSKLRRVLADNGVDIRDKSQQAFIERFGRLPRIRDELSPWKLYVIFAMLGDNLRPSTQTRNHTHIVGVAAGEDRDFAQTWIANFRQEYLIAPALLELGPKNIQAYISSVDIWNDLHNYAVFGRRIWKLHQSVFGYVLSDSLDPRIVGYGMRGYFDAEGSVVHEEDEAYGRVSASSVNPEGLRQISLLLDKLQIGHRVYGRGLAIFRRASIVRFQKLVGFSIARKHEALNNLVSKIQRKTGNVEV